MSIIAGIYCRKKGDSLPEQICGEIRQLVSRREGDQIEIFQNDRAFVAHVDVGGFSGSGHRREPDGSFMLIAGEILPDGRTTNGRDNDLVSIRDELKDGKFTTLEGANGQFCAAFADNEELFLATDKLGIRPLFYWVGERYVIFATALRILEGLGDVPKTMSVRAVTELAALGYSLSDRTPYEEIFVLNAAEVLQFRDGDFSRSRFWRWDGIGVSDRPEKELRTGLYKVFGTAVRRRLNGDNAAIAYLSGGLDSRCIVGALLDANVRVHTFNFARPDTQDLILGREFARVAQTIHTEVPKDPGDQIPDYSSKMADAWRRFGRADECPVERPGVAWSGEGGSVALGHVHFDEKIAELMRSGDIDGAIDHYFGREQIYLPLKLFREGRGDQISEMLREGVKSELSELRHADAARNFYLFLLLNDQRRKLYSHFENMDLHRLEFQLPFFDSAFVAAIVSVPLDFCLRHRLYVKWLYEFPAAVTAVAWQAYPGHEPCPLPLPAGLSYQWDDRYQSNERSSNRMRLVDQGREMVRARDFPGAVLSRINLRVALFIHSSGFRDYGYIIESAAIFCKYSRLSGGKVGN